MLSYADIIDLFAMMRCHYWRFSRRAPLRFDAASYADMITPLYCRYDIHSYATLRRH